jgi:hypothetical protein
MYKLIEIKTTNGIAKGILKILDGTVVISMPFDPANTDYQVFLKYQAEGGKVYGADEEVPNGQATE